MNPNKNQQPVSTPVSTSGIQGVPGNAVQNTGAIILDESAGSEEPVLSPRDLGKKQRWFAIPKTSFRTVLLGSLALVIMLGGATFGVIQLAQHSNKSDDKQVATNNPNLWDSVTNQSGSEQDHVLAINGQVQVSQAALLQSLDVTTTVNIGDSLTVNGQTVITGDLTANALSGNGAGISNVNAAQLNGYSANQLLGQANQQAQTLVTAALQGQNGTSNPLDTTAGGDLNGLYPNLSVVGLNGVALSIADLAAGNLLLYNGTDWVNQPLSGDLAVASTGVATIQDGVITNAKLANSALTVTAGDNLSGGGNVSLGDSITLDVVSNPTFSGQLTSTVANGTAPFIVSSSTKVTGLNADLLDGLDSTAFGDATAANQVIMLSRLGTSSDNAGTGTVFARLADIDDTLNGLDITGDVAGVVGATGDAADHTGSLFARLSDLYDRITSIQTYIGSTGDASSHTGSIFARLADLYDRVTSLSTSFSSFLTAFGNKTDAASNSTSASVQAKLNWLLANVGGGSSNIGSPTDAPDPNGSLFAQVRDIRQKLNTSSQDATTATTSTSISSNTVTVNGVVAVPMTWCFNGSSTNNTCPNGSQLSSSTMFGHMISAPVTYGVVFSTHQFPTLSDGVETTASNTILTSYTTYSQNLVGTTDHLIMNTVYYVRTYATTSLGTVYGNQLTFTTGTVGFYAPDGFGLVFYDAGSAQSWGRYLEAAPTKLNAGSNVAWCASGAGAASSTVVTGGSGTSAAQFTTIGYGKLNTAAIIANCSSGAALLATQFTGGGYTDWFLPNVAELTQLQNNLALVGNISDGGGCVWSSSEYTASAGYCYYVGSGGYSTNSKTGGLPARAIREF